jgi:coenzyme F420-0:L-glutamate ligase / coenzyme F420-1:gamma-L-glutamate ligase
VRGLDPATGDAPPAPASALVRRPQDDLFHESARIAVSAAQQSDAFGPGEVPREIVEDAVRAASAVPLTGQWAFVAVDSPAARRRVLAAASADDVLLAAPILLVPCVSGSEDSSDEAILLAAGAAIRTLAVALHAQRVGWSWDPSRPFDAEGARAALALGEGWRPLGIVAVGPMPEGGASRARPPVGPARSLDRRG